MKKRKVLIVLALIAITLFLVAAQCEGNSNPFVPDAWVSVVSPP